MRDVYLDPVSGDLGLAAGRLRMTRVGAESYAQRLRIRLRRWRGEYLLNILEGMPYASVLGTKPVAGRAGGPAALAGVVREAILSSPGIQSLETFATTIDARRRALIQFSAHADDGTLIQSDPGGFVAAEFAP